MPPEVRRAQSPIRVARIGELEILQDIERAAGELFRPLGMVEVADDEPLSIEALDAHRKAGHLWVSTDVDEAPVAYLVAELVDGAAHVEQVSVAPAHSRRGIGRQLIGNLADWARCHGLPAITLTTFREVPFNRPYYERLGFRPLADDELGPALREIRRREAAHGLDRWPRIAMRRDLA